MVMIRRTKESIRSIRASETNIYTHESVVYLCLANSQREVGVVKIKVGKGVEVWAALST